MRLMSDQEIDAFLHHGTRTAKLATVRADGRPHVVPIGFVADPANGDILFTTGENSVKGKNLRRDPRLSLVVDDEAPPYAYVQIDGIAILSTDLAEKLPWSIAIARRYLGPENAEEFARQNAASGEMLVRVRRAKTIAQAEIAS